MNRLQTPHYHPIAVDWIWRPRWWVKLRNHSCSNSRIKLKTAAVSRIHNALTKFENIDSYSTTPTRFARIVLMFWKSNWLFTQKIEDMARVVTVSRGGGGDYRTVQEAIDDVPLGNTYRTVIRVSDIKSLWEATTDSCGGHRPETAIRQ